MPEAPARQFRFGALILAAGGSSRMGTPKQLLRIGGIALVARAARAAWDAGARPVAVVLGADADRIRGELGDNPVMAVLNPDWRKGLATSVNAGLAALIGADPCLDAVALAPCDQPALAAGILARLADLHRTSGQIAAARYNGRNGAPAVFGRAHFAALLALTGDEGARRLLNAEPFSVASIELPELGADLDTPADFERWLGAHP
jgi:molybdenum cofactor cytidylyltransferase